MIQPVLPAPMQTTLEAIADGDTTRQIARRVHLSPNTVKDRLAALYAQLGAKDRANAVSIGFQLGVLDGRRPALPCVLADGVPLDALVAARERHGLTQRDMAARLGVSRVWLCHRETGRFLFPLLTLQRYATIVGVDLGLHRDLSPARTEEQEEGEAA
jgi:DNA-binding CsgD family transcriptional regulator/DNA-binding XRE family transcriptional regulator